MSNPSNTLDYAATATPFRLRRPPPERGQVSTVADPATGRATVEVGLDCPPRHVMELLTDFDNLPAHIFCLHEVAVIRQSGMTASVRYTMRLPFPLGRVVWTNVVSAKQHDDGVCTIEWALVDGDLSECSGQIQLRPAGEDGQQTHAIYQIHVEHKNRIPKRAQQLAVQWLLPRVIRRLCKRLEAHG